MSGQGLAIILSLLAVYMIALYLGNKELGE